MSTLKSRRKLSFFWLDCSNENFFRIVIPSGMARSHRMLLSDSRNNVNSAKVGTDSALCGAASGEASGDGEGARIAGVAVREVCPGVAVTGAGLGTICFARYISHTTSPTTQRATTIHAVRSINSVLHDQTQRRISF